MPLPVGKTPWPPLPFTNVFQRLDSWSAWYSGNPDHLSAVYGQQGGPSFDSVSRARYANHSSQYRGGVIGWLARWFWGAPTSAGEQRVKLHVPVAGDIAQASADLLYSEPPTISVTDEPTQAFIDDTIENGLYSTLLESAEPCSALGGVYLRVCWDQDVAPAPWISAVHADAAIPEWRWGRLSAATFWEVLDDDGQKVVRHLERHEPGYILHAVYEGTPDNLGKPIPLTAYDSTAGLEPVVPTGLTDRLTCVYIPNMRPNRLWRDNPNALQLGRSDYAGIEPLMDSLDETYTSWMRDLRLAKARLIVPSSMLETLGPGQGAVFNGDREIYEGVNALGAADKLEITQAQFAIRVDEHERTCQHLYAKIIGSAGYSGQTFGLTGDVAITATENKSRERKSFITRDRKTGYQRPQLAEIIETQLMIAANIFGLPVTPQKPTIEFGDTVSEDPLNNAQVIELLDRAGAISVEMKVRMAHPDWDDKDVEDEVMRIREDTKLETPDTFAPGEPGEDTESPEGEEPAEEDAE